MLTGDGDGAPFIEYSGNVCILQYANVNWISGQQVPSELMHTSVNSIWATVTSPESSTDEYRIFIDASGYISLQKNGINVTAKTKIRGQIVWIK